jgi:hypothetical protein
MGDRQILPVQIVDTWSGGRATNLLGIFYFLVDGCVWRDVRTLGGDG